MPIILGRKLRSKRRGSYLYYYIVQRDLTWPKLEILTTPDIQEWICGRYNVQQLRGDIY
jgi:hypothetical protein